MNPSEEKTELRTVDDFIRFFTRIPEGQWCCGWGDGTRHCAQGHLGTTPFGYTRNSQRLHQLFIKNLERGPMSVNDSPRNGFRQKHPKRRILAALNAIKANQEKK